MNILNKVYILALLTAATSCSEILDEPVISKISSEYYDTETGIVSLQSSLYSRLRWRFASDRVNLRMRQYGTDTWFLCDDSPYDMYDSRITPIEPESSNETMWNICYRMIHSCNILIDKLPKVERTHVLKNDADYNQALGEAYFFRALHFNDLVTQFGGVPLPLEYKEEIQDQISRSSAAEVYAQIITDYRQAINLLNDFKQVAYGRASKQAAQHFLAKAYLERASAISQDEITRRGTKPSDADSAAYFADQVINSGQFSLENNFKDVFDFNNAYYSYDYNEVNDKGSNDRAQSSKERIFVVKSTTNPDLVGRGDDNLGFNQERIDQGMVDVGVNNWAAYFASGYQAAQPEIPGVGQNRDFLLLRWSWSVPSPHCFDIFGWSANQHEGLPKFGTKEDFNRYDSRMYKSFRFHYSAWKNDSEWKWQNTDPTDLNTYNWGLDEIYKPGELRFKKGVKYGLADTSLVILPTRLAQDEAENMYKKPYRIVTLKKAEDDLAGMKRTEGAGGYIPPLIKYADNQQMKTGEDMTSQNPSSTVTTKDLVLARLAETYLIAGEAYARAGKYNLAVERTNEVRRRAAWKADEVRPWMVKEVHGGSLSADCSKDMEIKESDINSTDKLISFFLSERERELSGEAMRWIDLVRCEKLVDYVSKYHPFSDAREGVKTANGKGGYKFNLRPIPQSHIDRLRTAGPIEEEQNPGYY